MESTHGKVALGVLVALSCTHLLNDFLQSVVTASYPLLKEELSLSFGQIGLITLVYQMASSVCQPIVGIFFDRHPFPYTLSLAALLSLTGIVGVALSPGWLTVCVSVTLVGIGSSIVHPESSRIASLASHGHRGLAQSIFQVGGNFGNAIGPLLVALLVSPYGRSHILLFTAFSMVAFAVCIPINRWFRGYMREMRTTHEKMKVSDHRPVSVRRTYFAIGILLVLIFSKYVYMASITNYYTFYLIEIFGVSIKMSQIYLFIFLAATALGTLVGGPLGDRIGRKYVIWISILGSAPFSLAMPYASLGWTVVLSFCVGFVLSSAFPAIVLYAQELLPFQLGMVSGLFFGFSFGIAGIASAVLGYFADLYGIEAVYGVCAFMPLLGLVTALLPNLNKKGQDDIGK